MESIKETGVQNDLILVIEDSSYGIVTGRKRGIVCKELKIKNVWAKIGEIQR